MSVTCPNCGLSNEDDSKFCSQCGFQLPAVDSRTPSEFIPPTPSVESRSSPQRSSPEKVVFVSNRDYLGTNQDGFLDIFMLDLNTQQLTQITQTPNLK